MNWHHAFQTNPSHILWLSYLKFLILILELVRKPLTNIQSFTSKKLSTLKGIIYTRKGLNSLSSVVSAKWLKHDALCLPTGYVRILIFSHVPISANFRAALKHLQCKVQRKRQKTGKTTRNWNTLGDFFECTWRSQSWENTIFSQVQTTDYLPTPPILKRNVL